MTKLRVADWACYEALVRALWALCGGTLLMASCVTHRGPWRLEPPPPSSGVELVLLANIAPDDRGARAVAARVEQTLSDDRPRVLLWLGNVAAMPRNSATPRAVRRGPRCTDLASTWESGASATLSASAQGTTSYATTGIADHRCGHAGALLQDAEGPHPWQMPARHYVLRVLDDGSVLTTARCGDGGCAFDDPPASPDRQALVDLVVVDLSPWLYPDPEPKARFRDQQQVEALETLLHAIAHTPPRAAPPRLLVSSVPVEAGAEHGLGALRPDATIHNLPKSLQQMVMDGHFAGVLSAHDRSMYATADLSNAIKRADRIWLRAPVFQVTAGAVSRPNERAAMSLRRRRVRRSQAWRPETFSDHAGFAVIDLVPEQATITLHAHRGRRWETASMTVPLRPEPHPLATSSPHMGPCRDCPPIPATER